MSMNLNGSDLIRRRHPEWQEHHARWRWLLDSLEGGERYRDATYGYDRFGLPIRNLIRHKREYPDPREQLQSAGSVSGVHPFEAGAGSEPASYATDDDYELRRARTPVPTFLAEAVETHLSRIYAREVKRQGGPELTAWWNNVDGIGTSIDQWMAETVAPLLLTLGQIDLCFDHPAAPPDAAIESRADVVNLGLDRCIASYILPQNMLWWRLDETGHRYAECLVLESYETDEGTRRRYRHWTSEGSTLYDDKGDLLVEIPHGFGRVPVVRVFDRRKARCRNIGQSRYEGIAERQREYYNRDSELILSDTTQAHPLLQGPEDYVQADGSVPIGPGWLLPKKKNISSGAATYEGFEIVEFPKEGADSIRKNKEDLRDEVDREAALVRGDMSGRRAQSGLAKMIDHADGNNRLAKIAKVLAEVERIAAEFALVIIHDGVVPPVEPDAIQIHYPAEFDLYTSSDVARSVADFQALAARAGAMPFSEGLMLARLLRLCLPGMSDAQYTLCENEIRAHVERQGKKWSAGAMEQPWTEVYRRDVYQDINVI